MVKEDNRGTRRTRERIKNAMIELMKEKSFRSVTVNELVNRADVCRSTFYEYYYDVYNLVDEIGNEIISETIDECKKLVGRPYVEGEHPIVTSMMEISLRHKEVMQVLEGPNGDAMFSVKLRRILVETAQEIYKNMEKEVPPEKIELVSSFVVCGCIGLMSQVTSSGRQYSAEELGALCGEAIVAVGEAIFKN